MELRKLKMSKAIDEHTFGKYVRERREALGESMRGFANKAEVSAAYVNDIEKGNRHASASYVNKLIELFGIPEEDQETFRDMAAATHGYSYSDINPVLGGNPLAREALRKFNAVRIPEEKSDELWISFMREYDRIAEEQMELLKTKTQ